MESNKPYIVGAALLTVLILVALFFIFCFRIVGVGQVGIVTRFGRVTREVPSGVLIKAPWPIEHVTKMSVKTLKEQQDASAATKDLQTVTATVAVNYHLTPKTAQKVFTDVGTGYADIVIDPIIQEAIKSITADYNAEDLIGKRSDVEVALNTRLTEKLTDRGITVDNVSITNFAFGEVFSKAIEDKQAAQQAAQKAAYDLQRAQQEAQAQDAQAKTLTPEYLQLQAIQKWSGKLPDSVYLGNGQTDIFGVPLAPKGN